MVFHNELNYEYHFIMQELGNKFECAFNCLRENTEKYKTSSIPMTNEVKKIDKNGEAVLKITVYW